MTDVIDHLYRKASGQEFEQYKQRWDRIYQDFKEGVALPGTMLSPTSGHMQDTEATRNLLSRMAQDIAALQKERP